MAEPGRWREYESVKAAAIGSLSGQVLEIGAGTGANLSLLSRGVDWIGLEPHRGRRQRLAARAATAGHPAPPLASPAERIDLPDRSVDAVLSTLTLCSVRDQRATLAEVARVLRPGGRVVLAEHVVAPPGATRALQHLAHPFSRAFDHGCRPDRDTERALGDSALRIESIRRFDLPVLGSLTVPFLVVEAVLPATRPSSRDRSVRALDFKHS